MPIFYLKNDPFHFGTVGRAMLTLFGIATLDDWSNVYAIAFWGCESEGGGAYAGADGNTIVQHWRDGPGKLVTKWGSFPKGVCYNPAEDLGPFAMVYFYTFTSKSTPARCPRRVCTPQRVKLVSEKAPPPLFRIRRSHYILRDSFAFHLSNICSNV